MGFGSSDALEAGTLSTAHGSNAADTTAIVFLTMISEATTVGTTGFRVYGLPFMMYGGYPRYQYRGYWISLLDPYPEYWGDNWYQNDDLYVDYYNDGYYLYNRSYPGRPGIAISISF